MEIPFLKRAARNILAARETQEMQEKEDQAKELAMKVAQATMAQIKAQFEGDMQKIRAKLPTKDAQTVETAKDMKYIRDRQKNLALDCLFFFEDCAAFVSLGE